MIKNFALILISAFSLHALAAAPKGVSCVEDNTPDGNYEEFSLKAKRGGKYEAVYKLQKGDMRDGVEQQGSEVVIATDLTCTFGTKTPALVDCHREVNGDVVANFSVKLVTERTVDIIVPGKEYTHENYSVSVDSPELKENKDGDRYPADISKSGYLIFDVISGSCERL